MIETTQVVPVRTEIHQVWNHVRNIRNWAELMPGLQDYQIIDNDTSQWVLKVGVGALVRTVKVDVHVHNWDGPGRVLFSFKLQGDPVKGGGEYVAKTLGGGETEMTLNIHVEGTGPMAPMWEAMGGPLLPKFALAFARQLAASIEGDTSVSQTTTSRPEPTGFLSRLAARLRALCLRLAAITASR
jgi:carbon monoxide dehydrogenase subunit G